VWAALAISLLVAAVSIGDMAGSILFSAPHGVARLAERLAGGAPLPSALPTFTEEDWRAPLLRLLLWLPAAALAAVCARALASGGRRSWVRAPFWLLTVEAAVFVLAAAAFVRPFTAAARAVTVRQGRFDLLTSYDPVARRGFDYRQGRLQKLAPEQWIDAAHLTFRLDDGEPPDPQGRLTEALALPPGAYELNVLFDGRMSRQGDLLASLGGGQVLARTSGPLPSLTQLTLQVPIAVPQLWVQMSHAESAAAARRVDIVPLAIVPRSGRPQLEVKRVESIGGPPGAYMAYVDGNAYPEGGVFWTRGTEEAEVMVAPAGAPVLNLTLHAGPVDGEIRLTVDGRALQVPLSPEETRVVSVPVPAGARTISFRVRSPGAFRPASVDPSSRDTRLLGCQVRVEVGEPH
jgi:hypothetical protein